MASHHRACRASFIFCGLGLASVLSLGLLALWCQPRSVEGITGKLDKRILESSGLVASRAQKGVFWTHSDSGAESILYAIDGVGQILGRFRIEAGAVDWEDIATDDNGNLYVGDIGNNSEDREDLVVYRLPEPQLNTLAPGPIAVSGRLRYSFPQVRVDGPLSYDSEALFWFHGHLYLLTKRWRDRETILFRFPDWRPSVKSEVCGRRTCVLERVSAFPLDGPKLWGGMATGADVRGDAHYLALLSYHAIYIFGLRSGGQEDLLEGLVQRIDLQFSVTRQAEAIAWHGNDLVVTNEAGEMFTLVDPVAQATRHFPPLGD